ncbi:MAG: hypothetical protein OJF58_003416 [Enhydrobacter sp.]|nr:MAG: hypothetical protein OJF58_003416 [Enhydrobacter sp.]
MDFAVALKGHEFVLVQATVMPRETPYAMHTILTPSPVVSFARSSHRDQRAPFEGF